MSGITTVSKLNKIIAGGFNVHARHEGRFLSMELAESAEVAEALIYRGVDLRLPVYGRLEEGLPTVTGKTLLHELRNPDVMRVVLSMNRLDVNAIDLYGKTPLSYAVNRRLERVVDVLMEFGAQPSLNFLNNCPSLDILRTILSYNRVNVDDKDLGDRTPLYIALRNSAFEFAKVFLEHGAEASPGLFVCSNIEGIDLLLQFGADINYVRPDSDETLLDILKRQLARSERHSGIDMHNQRRFIEQLVKRGAAIARNIKLATVSLDEFDFEFISPFDLADTRTVVSPVSTETSLPIPPATPPRFIPVTSGLFRNISDETPLSMPAVRQETFSSMRYIIDTSNVSFN